MEDKDTIKKQKEEKPVLTVFRYLSVVVVTVYLVVLLWGALQSDDLWFMMIIVGTIIVSLTLPFLTVPFIVFWIYSLVVSLKNIESLRQRTVYFQILFYLQILDMILAVLVVALALRPAFNCDADIMERHYEKNAYEMRRVIKETRQMLPDSASLSIEFKDKVLKNETNLLSEIQLKELEKRLDEVGCIGIYVDNTDDSGYAELKFRRIGLGLYTFGLYDCPMSEGKQDSINKDGSVIVFNDSTIFIYGGGAFGSQSFPNKKEYLEKKTKK